MGTVHDLSQAVGRILAVWCVASLIAISPASGQTKKTGAEHSPLTILFHTDILPEGFHEEPSPLKAGENKFEVMVKDAAGKALDDVDVSLTLRMPSTSQTKTHEMTSAIPMKHYGAGIYRGEGRVAMPGPWTVKITVRRTGQEIGTRTLNLIAQ